MISEMFSVYDVAAKQYLEPFFAPTVDFAIRGFRSACETDGHQFCVYPEDYVLYKVGEFDGASGKLTTMDVTVRVALASAFSRGFGNQLEITKEEEA